jgi:hypothetical protein
MVIILSVVIHYLNVLGVDCGPDKTHAPLAVYSNAVLPKAITPQRFQLVARWHAQKLQGVGCM